MSHDQSQRRYWTKVLQLAAPLFIIAAMSTALGMQFRQDRLDRALIRAVKELDAPAVERLLAEAASANARDTGEPPLTLEGLIKQAVAKLQHNTKGAVAQHSDTVLQLLMKDSRLLLPNQGAMFDAIEAALIGMERISTYAMRVEMGHLGTPLTSACIRPLTC